MRKTTRRKRRVLGGTFFPRTRNEVNSMNVITQKKEDEENIDRIRNVRIGLYGIQDLHSRRGEEVPRNTLSTHSRGSDAEKRFRSVIEALLLVELNVSIIYLGYLIFFIFKS